ncbi:TatD family hydrolase [Roseofilum casamattae]|uniref:D-aminoacyl-tRNA deacylase n=1 Tax=Roseofilum casamattae BLCC-M143 TaxID=3022442 RepID=A0ABT7BX05_9CYAN|nr:TatD family hydrolase [Roseofilum casamattae]MDJ1182813.1 TatD family hydrolase [Roseofilum casamattae BLCC-M143]
MPLIDTHVHINFDAYEGERDELRSRWRAAEVVQLVHSCVTPQEFESIQSLAHQYPELYFSVGFHPLESHNWVPEIGDRIATLAESDPKVVAIGETGLDFYKADNPEEQYRALSAQLNIAQNLDLPVIIHCRDAASSLYSYLQEFVGNRGLIKAVMHCWGGTPEETQWFLDFGFYISFSGTVTFKKATAIHESCQMVPSDRILVETDCPFLAPVPKRGKRNEPAYVRHVAEVVASLRGVSLDTLGAQTTSNARSLFQLPVT